MTKTELRKHLTVATNEARETKNWGLHSSHPYSADKLIQVQLALRNAADAIVEYIGSGGAS